MGELITCELINRWRWTSRRWGRDRALWLYPRAGEGPGAKRWWTSTRDRLERSRSSADPTLDSRRWSSDLVRWPADPWANPPRSCWTAPKRDPPAASAPRTRSYGRSWRRPTSTWTSETRSVDSNNTVNGNLLRWRIQQDRKRRKRIVQFHSGNPRAPRRDPWESYRGRQRPNTDKDLSGKTRKIIQRDRKQPTKDASTCHRNQTGGGGASQRLKGSFRSHNHGTLDRPVNLTDETGDCDGKLRIPARCRDDRPGPNALGSTLRTGIDYRHRWKDWGRGRRAGWRRRRGADWRVRRRGCARWPNAPRAGRAPPAARWKERTGSIYPSKCKRWIRWGWSCNWAAIPRRATPRWWRISGRRTNWNWPVLLKVKERRTPTRTVSACWCSGWRRRWGTPDPPCAAARPGSRSSAGGCWSSPCSRCALWAILWPTGRCRFGRAVAQSRPIPFNQCHVVSPLSGFYAGIFDSSTLFKPSFGDSFYPLRFRIDSILVFVHRVLFKDFIARLWRFSWAILQPSFS